MNSDSTPKVTSPTDVSEKLSFSERAKEFLETCPTFDTTECSEQPLLLEKVEKIQKSITVICQEISEIEKMQGESELENIQPTPAKRFLESFNAAMSCKPC